MTVDAAAVDSAKSWNLVAPVTVLKRQALLTLFDVFPSELVRIVTFARATLPLALATVITANDVAAVVVLSQALPLRCQ
jgi:hypothetical protein